MSSSRTIIPIYTTRGDCGGYLAYPYIYNSIGEWIGWVTQERFVFTVRGQYIGWLTSDPRILAKRTELFNRPHRSPPPPPPKIQVPARVPLAPMMAELTYNVFDVLGEDPDLLPTVDYGEREDMD